MTVNTYKFLNSALLFLVVIRPAADCLAQSKPAVNIDLGVVIDTIPRGGNASLPVTLITVGDAQVAKITLDAAFPSKALSFLEATKGTAAESADAILETEVRDREDGEKVVQIQISAPRAIPQGGLVTLVFQTAHDVELESEITVRNLNQTAQSIDGEEIEAYGIDGSITLLTPAIPCFFYMH
ncbi:MAG: hypothetical protein HYX74_10300 [Acidobacteria bacterium]|nr:hypothetical protein [Acidobacteriota bacterium]